MQRPSGSTNETQLNSSLFRSFAKYVCLHGKQRLEILWLLVWLGKHVLAITRPHTSAGRSVQAPPFEFQRSEVVHCCRGGSLFFQKGQGLSGRPPGSNPEHILNKPASPSTTLKEGGHIWSLDLQCVLVVCWRHLHLFGAARLPLNH